MSEYDCVTFAEAWSEIDGSQEVIAQTYREHAWTWGADFGRYWARCGRCDTTMRFARQEGDRINQQSLTTFYREQWIPNLPAPSSLASPQSR